MAVVLKDVKYQKYCKHCKYMSKHPAYTQRVLNCSYFNKDNLETLKVVLKLYEPPISVQTTYKCLRDHHRRYKITPAVTIDENGRQIVDSRFATTTQIIEQSNSTNHEQGLDDFIQQGRESLARGEMQITASNFLQAIKVKSEIEKSTKDRRMEMIKTFFSTKPKDE